MNKKIKQIGIPFILMLILNLGVYYLTNGNSISEGLSPYSGVLLISGLLFGPYGAIGSVAANILCNIIRGYHPAITLISAIINFAVSYLAYKLWYEKDRLRLEVTKPKLNNISNILLFVGIVLVCGGLYTVLNGKLFYLFYPNPFYNIYLIELRYFLNIINSSFILGIIGIWISNKLDLTHIPKKSEKQYNEKIYKILGAVLVLSLIMILIIDYVVPLNNLIIIAEMIIPLLILFTYLTKPISSDIVIQNHKSIPEEIMNIFHLAILFIIFIGIIISNDHTLITVIDNFLELDRTEIIISMMILMDILLLIYFIPTLAVLKYIEIKVIKPIMSFSQIKDYIHENEKIESDSLIKIYSKYLDEDNEIGILARSYTDLISHSNNYIENIREIEGEKKRIEAELDIARNIQAANLPTDPIENEYFIVDGYSHPAKEVGGDFFDYYELDNDNLAVVIGDASGKGVPAAILAMISQVTVRQILNQDYDPSRALYLLNNQLCENNTESMFITLWLGIYNRKTKKITFSNGGHNPPLINENGEFRYLDMDSGIVLGVMEDFEYVKEEITLSKGLILYTDGITDANNEDNEMYGENRLLNFFNGFKSDDDPITPLLNDINDFTNEQDQFDDMTLIYLWTK